MLLRWVRPLATIAIVFGLGVRGGTGPRPGTHGAGLLVGLSLLGVVAGAVCLFRSGRRPAPPVVPELLVVAVVVASSGVLVWFEPNGSGFLGGYIAASVAGSKMTRRVGLAAAGAVVLILAAASLLGADRPASSILVPGCGLLAFYSAGRYARRLRDRTEQAERLLADLEETRDAQARAAALAERHRLAREMHDVLAHSLSGLLVQLEAARMLASRDPADPRLAETVERAHHLAGSGLQEARRAIGMLRDEELPGPERLAALAEEFERDTGVCCRLATSGAPRPLDPQARLTLYRVAQEALTNVGRHANSRRVDLRLDYAADGARLSVEDSGGPPTVRAAPGPGGYGLTGMRERAELLGGTLTANPTGAGFRVDLWIPG